MTLKIQPCFRRNFIHTCLSIQGGSNQVLNHGSIYLALFHTHPQTAIKMSPLPPLLPPCSPSIFATSLLLGISLTGNPHLTLGPILTFEAGVKKIKIKIKKQC